jgi:hypothetical protein
MKKKIEVIEFPEGSGRRWEIARSREWTTDGSPITMIRPIEDADEYGFENWRPILHPDFVAKVLEIEPTLEPLDEDETMDEAAIDVQAEELQWLRAQGYKVVARSEAISASANVKSRISDQKGEVVIFDPRDDKDGYCLVGNNQARMVRQAVQQLGH